MTVENRSYSIHSVQLVLAPKNRATTPPLRAWGCVFTRTASVQLVVQSSQANQ